MKFLRRLLLKAAYPMYRCENCIGMNEWGCYCEATGASAPGIPATRINRIARKCLNLIGQFPFS